MSSNRLQLILLLLWAGVSPCVAKPYTYEVFRFPDAAGTFANGIDNEGNISGNLVVSGVIQQRGFFRSAGGEFEFIDVPGRPQTLPLGMNNLGQIVGDTLDPSGRDRIGFIREPDGSFQEFTVPDALGFQVGDMNDLGQIVGGRGRENLQNDVFLRDPDGSFKFFAVPGLGGGTAYGINDRGIATGNNGDISFILDTIDGSRKLISYPGAEQTQFFGINNRGEIPGLWWSPTEGHHAFVRSKNGQYDELVVPGGGFATPWGINDLGQVVGHYDLPGTSVRYGFLATPVPEPSSIGLMAVAVVALAFVRVKR